MGLLDILPFLDGWTYDIIEQGFAHNQPPFPLTAIKTLVEDKEGSGYLLAATVVTNDDHVTLRITADGKELKLTAAELLVGGATQAVGGVISSPAAGIPFGPLGAGFTIQFQGFDAALPYRHNVSVTVEASGLIPNPLVFDYITVLVKIVDPAKFTASFQALYGIVPPTAPAAPSSSGSGGS